MNGKLITAATLGGLVLVVLLTGRSSRTGTDADELRIVRAPAMPGATASGTSGTGSPHGEHGGTAGSTSDSAEPVAVGFTLFGGTLYLVTAETGEAAELVSSVTAGGAEPIFGCQDPAATGTRGRFAAWELRAYGGSGALPPLSEDGRLLTTRPDGRRLVCELTNAQGN